MRVEVDNLNEFRLVAMLDCIRGIICLEIDGGPCYLVAPKLKKLKEIKSKRDYPCFKVSEENFELLNGAFLYHGYTID